MFSVVLYVSVLFLGLVKSEISKNERFYERKERMLYWSGDWFASFEIAEMFCHLWGGTLPEVFSEEDNRFFWESAYFNKPSSRGGRVHRDRNFIWLNTNKLQGELTKPESSSYFLNHRNFTWNSDIPSTYNKFKRGYPSNGWRKKKKGWSIMIPRECIAMCRDDRRLWGQYWKDIECSDHLPFLCVKDQASPVTLNVSFVSKLETWTEGMKNCQLKDQVLVPNDGNHFHLKLLLTLIKRVSPRTSSMFWMNGKMGYTEGNNTCSVMRVDGGIENRNCDEEAFTICVQERLLKNFASSPSDIANSTETPVSDPISEVETLQPTVVPTMVDISFTPTVSPIECNCVDNTNPTNSSGSNFPTHAWTSSILPSPSPTENTEIVQGTMSPTRSPTFSPSQYPTEVPSLEPTENPTSSPISSNPTRSPTFSPSLYPTELPSLEPTENPTSSPISSNPTRSPTFSPSQYPTEVPSLEPTENPTSSPISSSPTRSPTFSPSQYPTEVPSMKPIELPTSFPTEYPTHYPVYDDYFGF